MPGIPQPDRAGGGPSSVLQPQEAAFGVELPVHETEVIQTQRFLDVVLGSSPHAGKPRQRQRYPVGGCAKRHNPDTRPPNSGQRPGTASRRRWAPRDVGGKYQLMEVRASIRLLCTTMAGPAIAAPPGRYGR